MTRGGPRPMEEEEGCGGRARHASMRLKRTTAVGTSCGRHSGEVCAHGGRGAAHGSSTRKKYLRVNRSKIVG